MTAIQEIYSFDWWFSFYIDQNWQEAYNLINNVVDIIINKEWTT